jgi:hypothetical protein
MSLMYRKYPHDKETAIFYALSLMPLLILRINHLQISGKQEPY